MGRKETPLEKQLTQLMDRFETAAESTKEVLDAVTTSLSSLQHIEAEYEEVSKTTTALHDECEEYLSDERTLSRVLKEIQEPLSYFRDLSVITNKIGMESMYSNSTSSESLEMEYDLYSDELEEIITRIFECIQFFRSHPLYKESASYLERYTRLLQRVYSILIRKFKSLLSTCSAEIASKSDKNELLLSSCPLYYYMSALSHGNPRLISLLMKIHAGPAGELPEPSCFDLYCSARNSLLSPLLSRSLDISLASPANLASGAHAALFAAIDVSVMEANDYIAFFCTPCDSTTITAVRSSNVFTNAIAGLVEDVAVEVYERLRPMMIDCTKLEPLSNMLGMMKREVMAADAIPRDSAAVAMVPVVLRLEEDCRERMVYLAHLYFESAIRDYVPSSEDIDYPRKLYDFYAKKRQMESSENMPWFPPVQYVLRALSLLYTSIDYTVMADLTAEAVSATLSAIRTAANQISQKESSLDSSLFFIKTLLILREQLAPFDLHSRGTYLPFSDRSLAAAPLYRLFSRALPAATAISRDALRDIETALKQAAGSLIETVGETVCGQLVTLLQEYERFMATTASAGEKFPLAEQQVISVVEEFQEGVGQLENIVGKIALYVDSPATQGILFAPVRRVLLGNAAHLKEILVYLKPNNFPRYLEQLSEIEAEINEVDATKFSHEMVERECEEAGDSDNGNESSDPNDKSEDNHHDEPNDNPNDMSDTEKTNDNHNDPHTNEINDDHKPVENQEKNSEESTEKPTEEQPTSPAQPTDVTPDQPTSTSTAPTESQT
ncbi:hypothetical protein WA588_006418, partial [Blastocystis sp. NMH]